MKQEFYWSIGTRTCLDIFEASNCGCLSTYDNDKSSAHRLAIVGIKHLPIVRFFDEIEFVEIINKFCYYALKLPRVNLKMENTFYFDAGFDEYDLEEIVGFLEYFYEQKIDRTYINFHISLEKLWELFTDGMAPNEQNEQLIFNFRIA